MIISPHSNNELVDLTAKEKEVGEFLKEESRFNVIELSKFDISNIECLNTGVYTPLRGFMARADYESVLQEMKLENGSLWPIPITLAIKEKENTHEIGDIAILRYNSSTIGFITISDIFQPDKKIEAKSTFGTLDFDHPGVKRLFSKGEVYIGGDVKINQKDYHDKYHEFRLTPSEVRSAISKRGWKTTVGFMTRNPPHRAHEYLHKLALESYDGLFINPLIDSRGKEEIPDYLKLTAYQTLINSYYPTDRVILGIYPAPMNYAGPKDAILHAICRQNYGCTHFIVGRDHAGVGSYYGEYEAQQIFQNFDKNELKIQVLPYENAFYCKTCHSMATKRSCPHTDTRIYISGTRIKEKIKSGDLPKIFEMRSEVSSILYKAIYGNQKQNKPFCLWFTGLSGSGKSTLSKLVKSELELMNIKSVILDGDIIRENISSGLTFSKEDRDENIRRIGFVSKLIVESGSVVIVAAISPYKEIRNTLKNTITNFIEIYVKASVEECERRDVKGLYKKARSGEILNFTGISDPYEIPKNPDIIVDTEIEDKEKSVSQILDYLKKNNFI